VHDLAGSKIEITLAVLAAGAIPALEELLRSGSDAVKKHMAGALRSLSATASLVDMASSGSDEIKMYVETALANNRAESPFCHMACGRPL